MVSRKLVGEDVKDKLKLIFSKICTSVQLDETALTHFLCCDVTIYTTIYHFILDMTTGSRLLIFGDDLLVNVYFAVMKFRSSFSLSHVKN